MSVKERNQDLNMTVELVRIHLAANLKDGNLCKDMCAVIAINLRRVHDDAENSAKVWDKKHFHVKADELRAEAAWALPLSQIAESMAYTPKAFDLADCKRINELLPDFLEVPLRPRFKDISMLRGAAAAARSTLLRKR